MIIFALLFALFGLACFFNGATDNAAVLGALALAFLFMALLNSYNYRREKAFSQWLFQNGDRLWGNRPTDAFKGEEFEKSDTLTQFSYCVSFIFFTRTYFSHSYHTKNKGQVLVMGLFYTVINIIYGWWAVPLGPVRTVKNILFCLRGGHKYVLLDVLNDMPKMQRFEKFEDFLEYRKQKQSEKEN